MSVTPLSTSTPRREQRPTGEAAKCPLCGQSLTAAAHRRVEQQLRRREAQLRHEVYAAAAAEGRAEAGAEWAAGKAKLREEIEGLRRRLESKSVQRLGAEQELDLLGLLRAGFPTDQIEQLGTAGDLLHTVHDRRHVVGQILYEVKNERRWLNAWVEKLKRDAATRGIDHVLLVTTKLPAKTEGFTVIHGVIVCQPEYSVRFAALARRWAIESHRLGLDAPIDALYEYVASVEFRKSIASIVERAGELDADLVKEQGDHERRWARRRTLQARIGADAAQIDQAIVDLIEGTEHTNNDRIGLPTPSRGSSTKRSSERASPATAARG